MAIESAANFSRLARTGLVSFIGMLSLCGVVQAQAKESVTAGSIIPLSHSTSWCQVFNVDIAPNGDALLLDVCGGSGQHGSLYELPAGSTSFQTDAASLDTNGTYWNEGMAMDAQGTVYITDRYNGSVPLIRVPYNPADGRWDFSLTAWEPTIAGGLLAKNGTYGVTFYNSAARDGSGILFVSQQNDNDIVAIPVNAGGTVPTFTAGANVGTPQYQFIVGGLKDTVIPMTTDVNGNLYFIENPGDQPAQRDTGVFFVPTSTIKACMAASANGSTSPSTPCITGEGGLSRIDPGNTEKFNGITIDADGNAYVTDQSDGYGGTRNGLLEIPNESGSPYGVTASSFNFNDVEYLSPVGANADPTIDPRGFIWLPTGTNDLYNPNGSTTGIPGTGNLVLYQLGALNLGSTPVGTPSATGIVFYTFSGTVAPASLTFSQPGGGTDYSAVSTNPYPPATGNAATVPCASSTSGMQNTYIAFDYCEYWVGLTPQGTNAVGSVSGQLSMLNSSNNVISGSTINLTGVGQGPAAALLIPANQTPLATALVSPQQVAGDSLGNSYVADSGSGKVLMFPAGSTTASAGTSLGTFKAPTSVAVDGFGDVYVGDSGSVIEIPAVQGVLQTKQTTLVSGLGPNLNLAADDAGNVYVADPSNARVVKIYNPQFSMVYEPPYVSSSSTATTPTTIGSGFTKPTAVAVDDAGNVYVADGKNLDVVPFWGEPVSATTGQAIPDTIDSDLITPVTGLAVDPSGSVYVAQSGGVIRIPLETSGTTSSLQYEDAADIDSGGVTSPNGIGIDGLGNIYVTASSYGLSTIDSTSGEAETTNVTTPNVLLLNGALANFGLVSQFTQSPPIDINVYNIGNEPLTLTGETYAGTDAVDYSGNIEEDGTNPCALSGPTTIASASACQLGQTVIAQGLGLSQATMAVATNAVNAPTTTATLEAYSSDLLCRTLTTITLTPSTGLLYPASTTVSSVTVSDPASPCTTNPNAVPQGGTIQLTLVPQAAGSSETTQKQVLGTNGQATFNLTGLNGGTYDVFVAYAGDTVYGGSSSSRTFAITVAQAAPNVTLSDPSGISSTYGTYYILQGATATLQASVTSPLGSPTGSVQFINNGTAPADSTQNPVTLSASGTATFNTSNLAVGTYNLTAVYSGDTNFASFTSPVVTIVVVQPSALITASPASLTIAAGSSGTSTLTVTPLEGYNPQNGVQMYCEVTPVDTVPPDAECTFDVPLVKFASAIGSMSTPQITNMTITSNIPVNESAVRTSKSPIIFAGMFGLSLLGLAFRRKGKFHRSPLTMLCLMLLFAGTLVGFTGCTNSSYTHTLSKPVANTPAGTYNVSIYTLDLTTNQISSLPFTLSVTITAPAQSSTTTN